MATAVTSQKLGSTLKVKAFDHDPGATTAIVTSPDGGTTPRWESIVLFENFAVIAKPTVVGGNGLTLLEIVAATDSTGTDVTVVLAHAATVGNSLDEYVWLEVTAAQVKEVGDAASKTFTHVAARLTMATATDEASVVYIFGGPKFPQLNLTATSSN
jgi:hypothetical protein